MAAKISKQPLGREPARLDSTPAADRLLAWYDRHRRVLPWRALPGVAPDPYAVWLSEVMLQQTTVAAVKDYFVAFRTQWPRIEDLAAAPAEEVMRRWAGLGYYSRARNLLACARQVVAQGGGLPDTEAALLELPGIGPYTAAAIAAIAFDRRATVVDGNVERVIVRLHGLEAPIREVKPEIRRLADLRTPESRCGDYAQAMMDLGATICTPRRPACVICPLAEGCVARESNRQDVLPARAIKPDRPDRRGSIFYVRSGGTVLVRTRPDRGLLGGMTEFPGSVWDADGDPQAAARPLPVGFVKAVIPVVHGFTHFTLTLDVHVAEVPMGTAAPAGCRWIEETLLPHEALPSLMRKVAVVAQTMLDERVAAGVTRGAA